MPRQSRESAIITTYVQSDLAQAKHDLAELEALPYSLRTTTEYAASINVLSKAIRREERRQEQLSVKQNAFSPIMALATMRVASQVEHDKAALAGTLDKQNAKLVHDKAIDAIAKRIQQKQK
jgi:hypothetical protein